MSGRPEGVEKKALCATNRPVHNISFPKEMNSSLNGEYGEAAV